MASYQYIYVMQRLTKIFPGGKKVLDGITLAFLPGAKIGVLGVNGAGKSTLLRIMAGLDQDFSGEAWAAQGAKVGMLPQEPELDPAKDVLGNIMEGAAATKALLDRFDEVSEKFADPDADMDALMAEQAELQEQIDAANGWELQRTLDIAMDALRCPPGDQDVTTLSGGERRRVALCRLLLQQPDLLLLDEPTNHLDAESVAWLERFLQDYKGTVVAITHDRYFLDNVAGWILELDRGHGIPWQGNYSSWLEQKQKRLAQEERQEEARQRTLERELEWIRQSPRARQAKSKARITAYEDLLGQAQERAPGSAQIMIPPGPRLGDLVIEAEGLRKGYGDRLLIDDLELPPAARRHRRRDRRERRRQDHAVSHDHRPGAAGRRRPAHRRHGGAGLRRSEPRGARRRTSRCGRRFPAASTRSSSASARSTAAPTSPPSTSAAPTSRRRWASCPAASATGCTSPSC